MPTIIKVSGGPGESIRRCDARCYKAKGPKETCRCVCGGENHGAGHEEALANNLKRFGQETVACRELPLFDDEPLF